MWKSLIQEIKRRIGQSRIMWECGTLYIKIDAGSGYSHEGVCKNHSQNYSMFINVPYGSVHMMGRVLRNRSDDGLISPLAHATWIRVS